MNTKKIDAFLLHKKSASRMVFVQYLYSCFLNGTRGIDECLFLYDFVQREMDIFFSIQKSFLQRHISAFDSEGGIIESNLSKTYRQMDMQQDTIFTSVGVALCVEFLCFPCKEQKVDFLFSQYTTIALFFLNEHKVNFFVLFLNRLFRNYQSDILLNKENPDVVS